MGELERRPNAWALTPLVVFLLTYLVVSIVAGDFYKMPITVAFVISSIVAIAISKGGKLSNRIEQFCRGGQQQYHADGIDLHPRRCLRADRQGNGCRRRYRESGDVHPAR